MVDSKNFLLSNILLVNKISFYSMEQKLKFLPRDFYSVFPVSQRIYVGTVIRAISMSFPSLFWDKKQDFFMMS